MFAVVRGMYWASMGKCWLRTIIHHTFSLEAEWRQIGYLECLHKDSLSGWHAHLQRDVSDQGEGDRRNFHPASSFYWTSVRGRGILAKATLKRLSPDPVRHLNSLHSNSMSLKESDQDHSSLCGQEAGHVTNSDCWIFFFRQGWENRASWVLTFYCQGCGNPLTSRQMDPHTNCTCFLGNWRHITQQQENVGWQRRQR